jgi:hypothetical protein
MSKSVAPFPQNKELEKEVKFYQTRMAGAFTERDKALLEVRGYTDVNLVLDFSLI